MKRIILTLCVLLSTISLNYASEEKFNTISYTSSIDSWDSWNDWRYKTIIRGKYILRPDGNGYCDNSSSKTCEISVAYNPTLKIAIKSYKNLEMLNEITYETINIPQDIIESNLEYLFN